MEVLMTIGNRVHSAAPDCVRNETHCYDPGRCWSYHRSRLTTGIPKLSGLVFSLRISRNRRRQLRGMDSRHLPRNRSWQNQSYRAHALSTECGAGVTPGLRTSRFPNGEQPRLYPLSVSLPSWHGVYGQGREREGH